MTIPHTPASHLGASPLTTRSFRLAAGYWLTILVLGCCGSLNYVNNDSAIYQAVYGRIGGYIESDGFIQGLGYAFQAERFEWGYLTTAGISNFLHVPYQGFFAALFLASLLLVGAAARTLCTHPVAVLWIYALYPFFYDVIQIRYTVGQAIVVYAIRHLRTRSWKSAAKFFVLVLLATSFHTACILFLLLLLVFIQRPAVVLGCSLAISFAGALTIYFAPNLVAPILGQTDITDADVGAPGARVLMFGVMTAAYLIGAALSLRNLYFETDGKPNAALLRILFVMPVFVALLFFDAQFYRLLRTGVIFACIAAFQIPSSTPGTVPVKFDLSRTQLWLVLASIISAIALMYRQELVIIQGTIVGVDFGATYIGMILTHNFLVQYLLSAFGLA